MKKISFKSCVQLLYVGIMLFAMGCQTDGSYVTISTLREGEEINFAIDEVEQALLEKDIKAKVTQGDNADISIIIEQMEGLTAEGFQLINEAGKISITAFDEAGAMYGGLELAEQIKLYGLEGVTSKTQNPYMQLRGTKFNIPLDLRTPSYSDMSDVAQKNIPEMWNFDFWKEYIDNLARYRYNYISLWNLHPFPSMVKVPGYEEVALDDVQRSTKEWDEFYSTRALDLCSPEILANPEIVKKISMEEKIAFWKKVMAYGKSRNVDFYVITWNIYAYGAQGKYGITNKIDNPVTRDYYRKSVKQMFLSYPDLAGIGLTTGEDMHGHSFKEKEDWAFDTYAKGVMDAAEEMPERNFTFIHRQHMAGAPEIADKFQSLIEKDNIEFIFSFKYAKAHVMSATRQPYHERFVKEIGDLKTIWTLRNDDNYYFRWGAPDFVREFIQNIPYDISRGIYYGSDQWIWGREFTSKQPEGTLQLEIVKHWYHWMMWGRLSYDSELSNDRFKQILQNRYPEIDAEKLFSAWQDASMIYPITTGFHWGPLDFHWYIEACRGRKRYTDRFTQNETGFHDVNVFINLSPHKYSGFQSIPEYVETTLAGNTSELKTPIQVAEKLHKHAGEALAAVESMNPGDNQELEKTLHDIKTMASLGKYYAYKIAGSTWLALFRETKDEKHKKAAIEELEKALNAWEQYAEYALQQNINPIWTNRVGYVDWLKITQWVANDIEIARAE